VREVLNYIAAMERGLDLIESLPTSRRPIEELHAVLLRGVRGGERDPGHVRTSPNRIGSTDNTPATAAFVPPPATEMEQLDQWLIFFLTGVTTQANDAVGRSERLIDLRADYLARLQGSRSRAREVVDLLLMNPIATTRSVSNRLEITLQGATNLLKQLAAQGIIQPLPRVSGRSNRWIARDLHDALVSPTPVTPGAGR